MAQTTEIFPQARKIYKKLFKSKTLNHYVHRALEFFVDGWSKIRGFYFPKKFNWEYKWEMLSFRFERETVSLFKKIIKPGMSVVDIGAHVGYYTTFFAKLVGPTGAVYSFEPDADNFKILEKNARRYRNVKLYNLAVSDKIGAIDFYKVNQSTGCHSLIPTDNSVKISVPTVTVDQFILENGIPRVDVIKIDIEGGESLAFAGMRDLFLKAKELSIITEFNPKAMRMADISPQKFIKNFMNLGFKVYEILPAAKTRLIGETEDIEKFNYYQTGFVNLLLKK